MGKAGIDKWPVRWMANWLHHWVQNAVMCGTKSNWQLGMNGMPLGIDN